MKYFSVEQWDNDYNTFVQTWSVKAESLEDAKKICRDLSWSGYSYLVKEEINYVIAQYFNNLERN